MKAIRRVFVGQLCDQSINNPQVLNTRALLSRFNNSQIEWIVPYYSQPDPQLVGRENIRLIKLWRRRFWQWHKFLLYQMRIDAVFYPNAYWFDDLGLQLRKITGRKVPVIATLEGLCGNEERQQVLTQWAGHPVYCQGIDNSLLRHIARIQREADHVIAISPFLAQMGRRLYGEKFCVLPLGVDRSTFFPDKSKNHQRFRVMGAGRIYDNKRPGLFLDLAARFPCADFVWFGEGELRALLLAEAERRGLKNLSYPGAVDNSQMAEEMRTSELFVLPSLSEGVPKVIQEAAGCGLPLIVFGFYEAPSVINGKNGYVVWDDEELFVRVEELINNPQKARSMGMCGAEMALTWDWDIVATRWEKKLLKMLDQQ